MSDSKWYLKDEDLPPLPPDVIHFFSMYSKIPQPEIENHVRRFREKAYKIFPYPCIGQYRFLDFSISQISCYTTVLDRLLKCPSPESSETSDKCTLVDVGCCLGADLRKLVYDGVSDRQLHGIDIRPEFMHLGYDLFNDAKTFKPGFSAFDVLHVADDRNMADNKITDALPKFDFVFTASFFHLFTWKEQVVAGTALARLLKAKASSIIFGRFAGSVKPGEYDHPTNESGKTFAHDEVTFQALWKQVESNVGGKWNVSAEFLDSSLKSYDGRANWKGNHFQIMHYVIERLDDQE